MNDKTPIRPQGFVGKWWARLRPLIFGLAGGAFVAGILFWGGFNWAMEMTNTESFCISCHEMRDNVYAEYRNTVHYSNRTGVRATCPDCHVPKEWTYKIMRKIQASNEVWHKLLGSIDTPEKFNAKRLELAKHEWDRMKGNDSRECRNCHNFDSFDYAEQGRRSANMHQTGLSAGQTCIDCHKGIAHTMPAVEQGVGLEKKGASAEELHPANAKAAESGKSAAEPGPAPALQQQ
ncbi:MAG: NapC/NirT family cytochrome c [Planctomycetes bacterium]|jgi:cytochrome c-type protein NapC|nr:NapC/NirT family cytochrome c [Planctomycetota bacterium]